MNRRPAVAVLALSLALGVVATPALGHVPAFSTDNDDPGNATYVSDPAKSWSFYDRVDANESAYYRLHLESGERLQVSTFVPRADGRTPGIVVMSPALNGTDGVPAQVEVPEGYGARVVDPSGGPSVEYEPFTPAALYRTAELQTTVETGGTYYVAAYDPDRDPGPVGVVIGHQESFGVAEYVSVPLDRPRIHEWEGQPAWFVYGPFLVGFVGVLLASHRWTTASVTNRDARSTLLAVAAALYAASTVGVAVQTAIAISLAGLTTGVVVTLAFVGIPAALGWSLLGRATDGTDTSRASRLTLLAVAFVGVVTWAGFVVGPALAVVAAVLPAE